MSIGQQANAIASGAGVSILGQATGAQAQPFDLLLSLAAGMGEFGSQLAERNDQGNWALVNADGGSDAEPETVPTPLLDLGSAVEAPVSYVDTGAAAEIVVAEAGQVIQIETEVPVLADLVIADNLNFDVEPTTPIVASHLPEHSPILPESDTELPIDGEQPSAEQPSVVPIVTDIIDSSVAMPDTKIENIAEPAEGTNTEDKKVVTPGVVAASFAMAQQVAMTPEAKAPSVAQSATQPATQPATQAARHPVEQAARPSIVPPSVPPVATDLAHNSAQGDVLKIVLRQGGQTVTIGADSGPANEGAATHIPAPATTPPAQAWNVREPSHRLHDAIRGLDAQRMNAESGQSTPTEAPTPAFVEQATPVVPTGDNSFAKALEAAGAAKPTTDGAMTPAPELAPADGPEPAANIRPEGVVPTRVVKVEWAAQPQTDSTGATRQPSLLDQVRQVSEFLAERTEGVIRMGDHGVEAQLRLDPPDLGGVRVNLIVRNDLTVSASFVADRPETAAMLDAHLTRFREIMGQQGLIVDRVSVAVSSAVATAGGHSPGGDGNPNGNGNSANERRADAQAQQRREQQDQRQPSNRQQRNEQQA